jgi:UDP-N-acetylmuramate dehydrogenase
VTLSDLAAEGLVVPDRPLGALTTYKFGGPAAWYGEPGTKADLVRIVKAGAGLPLFVLGRGSNVVVADSGFAGVVVRLSGEFMEMAFSGEDVVAGAAVSLPRLARACAGEDRGGLEFYVGIPGSVGGAVMMNAGGHGSDTAEWLVEASVLDTVTGRESREGPTSLDLRYRHSRLKRTDIVLDARFRTLPRARREGEQLMREITSWRKTHQPGGTLNAGSVFKNPAGDAAGRLIDSCGLKGFTVGGVSVSERHANFFVAGDEATAQDVFGLVAEVRRLVAERTGVELQPELEFLGDFSDTR